MNDSTSSKAERCEKPAGHFACYLPKGHAPSNDPEAVDGHLRGGTCFAHGDYTGSQCPQWPKCVTDPQLFKSDPVPAVPSSPAPAGADAENFWMALPGEKCPGDFANYAAIFAFAELYAADLRSKLAEATNRHDYYPDYQEAVAKLAEAESREAALRASIKEAQSLLADMHTDPPLNSGARWRGECPEGCQACAVLRVLSGDSTSVSTQERKDQQ